MEEKKTNNLGIIFAGDPLPEIVVKKEGCPSFVKSDSPYLICANWVVEFAISTGDAMYFKRYG